MQETEETAPPPGQEDPLEEGLAAHSSMPAWRARTEVSHQVVSDSCNSVDCM